MLIPGIVLGVILIVIGAILHVPYLVPVGAVILVVCAILLLLDAAGHGVSTWRR